MQKFDRFLAIVAHFLTFLVIFLLTIAGGRQEITESHHLLLKQRKYLTPEKKITLTVAPPAIVIDTIFAPEEEIVVYSQPQNGSLTPSGGIFQGPSGLETYYNLDMSLVVHYMRNLGYSEDEYPYWVRDDGVKMLGNYVMIAASLDIRPKGSVVETSLGPGLVCDTGYFAQTNQTQIDIATNW